MGTASWEKYERIFQACSDSDGSRIYRLPSPTICRQYWRKPDLIRWTTAQQITVIIAMCTIPRTLPPQYYLSKPATAAAVDQVDPEKSIVDDEGNDKNRD